LNYSNGKVVFQSNKCKVCVCLDCLSALYAVNALYFELQCFESYSTVYVFIYVYEDFVRTHP